MNWFPCVKWAHFCGLLFLKEFYSTFSYSFISYRKICGKKSKQLSIYLMYNIWCAVCGSVWTKIPTAQIHDTHIQRQSQMYNNKKHVSIYIVPVLNYMCWRMQRYIEHFSPRPVHACLCMQTQMVSMYVAHI